MFFVRNFVASARWTKPCGQNTSHSNNGCHYEQKNENVTQSESESTVQKVINTICFLVSDSVAAGYKSSCTSNCIISVDMAPIKRPIKSSDFCLQFPRPARSTFTWTWHVSPPISRHKFTCFKEGLMRRGEVRGGGGGMVHLSVVS